EDISIERRGLLIKAGAAALLFVLPRNLLAAGNVHQAGFIVDSAQAYPETIAVLQQAYANEYRSRAHYQAFTRQALKDGHPNIAHLFTALAASEAIHVRNYGTLLEEMGQAPVQPDVSKLEVRDTQDNLRYAAEDELAEVDRQYPALLTRLKSEGHQAAIEKVNWSWQAERQHRELIARILSGTGIFFGMLSDEFRENTLRYFVCSNCGSTLVALPQGSCPVCGEPVEVYDEISKPG
ncbi:MAG: ferritin family protein, partial [Mariprofundaceae bacterium]|nr:ferritin family protein [Mariprofundaceae bacterium]